jgi:sec-independent protein translocase protein TatC
LSRTRVTPCFVVLAAVITPTPDVFNLMIFSVPMVVLYFVGVFAGYLLELSRAGQRFPWGKLLLVIGVALTLLAGSVWLAIARYGYRIVYEYPYLIR